ncbi:ABC transporter substrate-binding protein [Streptomyces violaceus]|uniref:ABC transporter substrate-binding protein n=1 Tax=Streptomyces violaceus TaxID=1936 RepID=A0ABZ1P4F1_STRVL
MSEIPWPSLPYSRRGALRLGGRVLTGAALAGLAATGAVRSVAASTSSGGGLLERPLRIGYLPITDASTLLVAYERGLLAEAGIDAERPVLFRSWDSLAQALTTDQVDVVHMLMPMALQLRIAKKAPLKVVAWGHTNGSALTVAPRITDVAQLAGFQVAIPFWWSVHNVLLQRMLAAAGLKAVTGKPSAAAGTVGLLVMSPADMVPALQAGSIAGFVVADPFSALAEAGGAGHVLRFLGDVWKDHACCAVTVREDLATRHPEATTALVTSVVKAQQWLSGHRAQGARTLGPTGFLPQPVKAIDKVFTRTAAAYRDVLRHPAWQGQRLGFSAFPAASYTASLVELMDRTTVDGDTSFLSGLTGAAAHRELVDDRFATQALSAAGLPLVRSRKELIAP